jgi:hypothetical protein
MSPGLVYDYVSCERKTVVKALALGYSQLTCPGQFLITAGVVSMLLMAHTPLSFGIGSIFQ